MKDDKSQHETMPAESPPDISRPSSVFALVATPRFLLLVDLHTKNVIPLEFDRPEYYGISWFPEAQDLVLSHSMVNNSDLTDISAYALSEVGILSHGAASTAPFLSQPHQILCGSDGRVICTNTGRNAISVIDFAKPGYSQEARISSARWDRLSLDNITGDHLNSMFEKDGLLYVMAHRYGKGSVLATLSYPDLQVVSLEPIKNRTGLHNVWVTEEGQKIGCHSEAGMVIDLHTNEVLWESGSPVYTRGLAATHEFVLIGESTVTERASRHSSMSGLWLVDRRTWQTLDYFCLGPYGAVHEVRLLNVADHAHHGRLFGGLSALLARDLREVITRDKVESSRLWHRHRRAWEGFELVFGAPTLGDQAARIAGTRELCLLAKRSQAGQAAQAMKFRYSLDHPPGKSHVSVVAYRGQGTDRNMHALLIQPSQEACAHLNLWIQDGNSWSVQPALDIRQLPLQAEIEIQADAAGIQLSIDGNLIAALPPEIMPLHEATLGIRWLGATIYPSGSEINP